MEETAIQPQTVAPTSFMTRAVNVFTAPGELFSEISVAPPRTSSWLIPYILMLVMAVLATYAILSNPALRQQIFDIQERAMKEKVASGQLTQQQFDQISSSMESSGPVLFLIFGAGGQILLVSATLFGLPLLLMLITRLGLKTPVGYGKLLESFGLTTLIGLLGTIITILLMNLLNTIYATPGPVLAFLGSYDPLKTGDRLIGSVNIFTLWETGVLGIAVSRLTGKSAGTGLGLMYLLWALWVVLVALTGFGMK
ncbi:MAG TPA: hypothetical protein VMW43_08270 [Bacteroidota bacterium]|nr:hypothetical protein [Bacteroidota bacterium]